MLIGSGFVLLAWIVLWIAGFIDAFTADSERIRVMPKAVWVILILLFSGFAAIAWFIFGRPRATEGAGAASSLGSRFGHPSAGAGRASDDAGPSLGGWQLGGAGGTRRAGPMAPDDDPEFLRSLGKRRRDEPGGGKPDSSA